jgi:hypothetical protein
MVAFNSWEEDRILPQYPWQAWQPDLPLINHPRAIETLLKWAPGFILYVGLPLIIQPNTLKCKTLAPGFFCYVGLTILLLSAQHLPLNPNYQHSWSWGRDMYFFLIWANTPSWVGPKLPIPIPIYPKDHFEFKCNSHFPTICPLGSQCLESVQWDFYFLALSAQPPPQWKPYSPTAQVKPSLNNWWVPQNPPCAMSSWCWVDTPSSISPTPPYSLDWLKPQQLVSPSKPHVPCLHDVGLTLPLPSAQHPHTA